MRIGDLCTIDADGYLRVVGRTSDIIIRGGKNISAPAVEAEVAEHPAVAVAAAVAMPDEVFGERVCLYAELEAGRDARPRRRSSTSSATGACHPSGSPSGSSWSTRSPAPRAARSPRASCAPTSAADSTPVAERSARRDGVVSSRLRGA